MAIRNQPYIPLYVQDFATDEKLLGCSAATVGVYIRLMCYLHKCDPYGKVLLKQKFKQNDKQILNFAMQFANILPYDLPTIQNAFIELFDESVIQVDGDIMYQKRMVKDSELSDRRALAGKKGGDSTQKNNDFAKAKWKSNNKATDKAKKVANTENENENENIDVFKDKKRTKTEFLPPSEDDVISYFDEKGYSDYAAKRAFEYYNTAGWVDSQGKKVKNWKQKMISIWFKPENLKQNGQQINSSGNISTNDKQQQRLKQQLEYLKRGANNGSSLFGEDGRPMF